jgi:lipoprotein signal peptidase
MSDPLESTPSQAADPMAESTSEPSSPRPRIPRVLLFAVLAGISLVLDLASKSWAERHLTRHGPFETTITVVKDHLWFSLAYNKGGAWGLLHDAPDALRRPFFVIVSVLAIFFIVSLYRKLHANQWALRWGLPLVLGGALGNLMDRIVRTGVVDFIQYRAEWVGTMNSIIHRVFSDWIVVEYWPTFNVADIAICIGVGLMAIDMIVSKRHPQPQRIAPVSASTQSEHPNPSSSGL